MPVTTTGRTQANPFIKHLTSSNRTTRARALASLHTYLRRTTAFSSLEFLKLWKGLFYCLWMQDKPLHQQSLARDLANLVDVLVGNADNVFAFIEAFWTTISREWSSIDALRMDKFMYLVRCYVHKGFEVCAKAGWESGDGLERYLRILGQVPFNALDSRIPAGLKYHVVDVYVDELEKVDGKREAPIERVLAPLEKLGEDAVTKSTKVRVFEALNDERLREWSAEGADEVNDVPQNGDQTNDNGKEEDEEDEFAGFGD